MAVSLEHNDFAYGWAEDPKAEGQHNQQVVMVSTYVEALERELGLFGVNRVRKQLNLTRKSLFKESE